MRINEPDPDEITDEDVQKIISMYMALQAAFQEAYPEPTTRDITAAILACTRFIATAFSANSCVPADEEELSDRIVAAVSNYTQEILDEGLS